MKTRQHGFEINKSTVRSRLKPRREPYWRELSDACYLGFRRTDTGSETWIARWTDADSRYHYKSLGSVASLSYDAAKREAETWFDQCRGGVVRAGTVEDACKQYVANLRVEKGDKSANDAEYTFKRLVYEKSFGRTTLDRLTSFQVRNWRNALVADDAMRESSANRIFRKLKAALNFAYRNRIVASDAAWRTVSLFKGETSSDRARTLYLDPAQRRRILDECGEDTANLVRGLLFTMGRPLSDLELPVARVKDFDAAQKVIRLRHKKGRGQLKQRDVPLSDEAVEFFRALYKDKLPAAFLFTYQGEPWQRYQWKRELRAAVAAANKKAVEEAAKVGARAERIPDDVVAYTFRHCAICDRLKAGISIGKVAHDAGTSVGMIEKFYGKYAREDVSSQLAAIKAF